MQESDGVVDFILKYWVLLALGTGTFATWIEMKLKVRANESGLEKANARIDEVESQLNEDVKEIHKDITRVGEGMNKAVNDLRQDMREDQRETHSSVREILTILSKRGD